jgi:isopentenyl diphosphate isomerase/L-lactate dehydrogenase-like FMN-dependent dehydrogenase
MSTSSKPAIARPDDAPAEVAEIARPASVVPRGLRRAFSVDDVRRIAERRLPRFIFDSIEGGAESEDSLRRNRMAFERFRLIPRYLVDVRQRDIGCTVFGRRWGAPVGIAPTGLSAIVSPAGDIARARAASRRGVPFVMSTVSSEMLEDIAIAADGNLWFQLYLTRDESIADDLMRRARAADVEVLVVTIDIPVNTKRERDLRHGFTIPLQLGLRGAIEMALHPRWSVAMARAGAPNAVNVARYLADKSGVLRREAFMEEQAAALKDWAAIDRIRERWPGKLVLKGILSEGDVSLAAEHGADGIIVSNHGGRQLDAAPATIEMLPRLVNAAPPDLTVMIDSGITRGADIVKALALGARFAFVGKASLYGLGAGGEAGVSRVLEILADEVRDCIGQIGCTSLDQLGPQHILAT